MTVPGSGADQAFPRIFESVIGAKHACDSRRHAIYTTFGLLAIVPDGPRRLTVVQDGKKFQDLMRAFVERQEAETGAPFGLRSIRNQLRGPVVEAGDGPLVIDLRGLPVKVLAPEEEPDGLTVILADRTISASTEHAGLALMGAELIAILATGGLWHHVQLVVNLLRRSLDGETASCELLRMQFASPVLAELPNTANEHLRAYTGALRSLAQSRSPEKSMGEYPFLLIDVVSPDVGLGMVHDVTSFASLLLVPSRDLTAAVMTLVTADAVADEAEQPGTGIHRNDALATKDGLVVAELMLTKDERLVLQMAFALARRLARAERHDLETLLSDAVEDFMHAPNVETIAIALGRVCRRLGVAEPTRREADPSGAWFARMITGALRRLSATEDRAETGADPLALPWFSSARTIARTADRQATRDSVHFSDDRWQRAVPLSL